MFHYGHLQLLRRIAELADEVVVAVSTDEFNAEKGKRTMIPFEHRREIVSAIRFVDKVIPESGWGQKRSDIVEHGIDLFVMGDDWAGRFDELGDVCDVRYLPRTTGVSSSGLREALAILESGQIEQANAALAVASEIIRSFGD